MDTKIIMRRIGCVLRRAFSKRRQIRRREFEFNVKKKTLAKYFRSYH
jgi:hypothetical protein